ncbi:hypothetical protein VVD49_21335 [Uliginosibacterium sp. H3]|uniref:Ig-like domain-containing protein n=1 Tax=Uliginosibacterium silvisoli TaxID=3114758 RepID=A0ABU6KBF8_9RHOO|nr:hypothetical protein [Uliginosibacterium sp. H3]
MKRLHVLPSLIAPLALAATLASCGGSDGVPDALESISITKMECPISSAGASIPPGTNSQVKAYASIIGINNADVIWTWDADNTDVKFGTQRQNDNTSTIDITAPNFTAKYKINVHATAKGKRGDATCELEVK